MNKFNGLIAPNLLLRSSLGDRYYEYMKNTVQAQGQIVNRPKLISQLLGVLDLFEAKGHVFPQVGAMKYVLLRVRGRMAHLQPITETGDAKAIAEYTQLVKMEKEMKDRLNNLEYLRKKSRGATRVLLPVL